MGLCFLIVTFILKRETPRDLLLAGEKQILRLRRPSLHTGLRLGGRSGSE
jgi:hypothetical protein